MESDLRVESEETVNCYNCTLRIITEVGLYVTCAGPCEKLFHNTCVGLNKEHLRSLTKGVVWMCRDCSSCFTKWKSEYTAESRSSDASSLQSEVSALKYQVASIMQTLSSITASTSSADVVIHHSTPISSSRLMNGTKTSCEKHCDEADKMVPQTFDTTFSGSTATTGGALVDGDGQSFSLLLTNIHNSVTESDIRTMVVQCVGAPSDDCINVIKLVPRGVECNTFDFLSFKVILKKKWQSIAMSASTWPSGVKYRQFISRKINTWKPRNDQ